jgi:hypothetical protein
MFFEVTRRNVDDTEISELKDLDKNRAMKKTVELKFGWFSLKSFSFQFEPSLDELEGQLKTMMQESLDKLSQIRSLNNIG